MIISETKFCTYLDNLDKFLFAKYDVESRVRFVWLRSLSEDRCSLSPRLSTFYA